ncbi:hypothetical protein L227DRAFT_283363 [Lentinus tigrinus ALCF2SS1-6]|uniref:Uncharacterized protein n=1 Tax=Lentinus tigrinus ALCF2SS1-6 TaxID=1328759 RepID=A0A5C2RYW2_9APHY|nr:hypothetical protein L227DRAFT_283363 [Lentinus tigrinus ALCF2SS1-6]
MYFHLQKQLLHVCMRYKSRHDGLAWTLSSMRSLHMDPQLLRSSGHRIHTSVSVRTFPRYLQVIAAPRCTSAAWPDQDYVSYVHGLLLNPRFDALLTQGTNPVASRLVRLRPADSTDVHDVRATHGQADTLAYDHRVVITSGLRSRLVILWARVPNSGVQAGG